MKIEIERKFLVADDRWKSQVVGVRRLRDGLIARGEGRKVRLRIEGAQAWLTVKTERVGLTRLEYDCEVPIAEAEHMLLTCCPGAIVVKTRHLVPFGGLTWEVDVYEGDLAGVVVAEVELEREDQAFPLPPWVGGEVTGDPAWAKHALLERSRSPATPLMAEAAFAAG